MVVDTTPQASTSADRSPDSIHYRYPGSPPFQDSELDRQLFRGRGEEADQVLHGILSSNLFLLFAMSGLGKTSLLNAGVVHELRARAHWPVAVRLNDPTKRPVVEIREQIEDAARDDPSIDLVRDPNVVGDVDPDASLWDLFTSLEVWRGTQLQQLVVIFDQFEELFTLGWASAERQRFITEFGEVMRRHRLRNGRPDDAGPNGSGLPPPTVKVVIVIREDSLGELEALAADVPQILRNRFRLGPLDKRQAEAAIREPALLEDERLGSQRFTYTQAASQEILDFLSTETERDTVVRTDTVDPSQLQIVCQYVERAILPHKVAATPTAPVEIDAADLGGRAGLDRILGDFYRRTIESFPSGQQSAVRRLCERGLINPNGRRLSLEEGEIAAEFKVSPAMLQQLVDERLLRADARVGSVYYELAHDTLVSPIHAYSDEQRARRNRRRVRWAAIAAGCLVLAIGAALLYWLVLRSPSDADSAEPLRLGEPLIRMIDEPGDVAGFSITADRERPLRVIVTPTVDGEGDEGSEDDASELDIAIELTNAQAVTRQQNQLGRGQPEVIIVPPVPAGALEHRVSVTSFDSSTGSFEVAVEEQESTELGPGEEATGNLAEPGDLAVYRVVADGSEPIAIDIVPVTIEADAAGGQTQQKPPAPLDVEVELVDPAGIGTRTDSRQAGERESARTGGTEGEYILVVRGYQASTGPFDIVAAERGVLLGEITAPGDEATFTFDHAGDEPTGVVVTPDDELLDPVIKIIDPSGSQVDFDLTSAGQAEIALFGQAEGPYAVTVTGFDTTTGRFGIERTQPAALTPGQPVGGELTSTAGATPFIFDVSEPGYYAVTVSPDDSRSDFVVTLIAPNGEWRDVDSAGEGEAEVVVFGGAERPLLVVVRTFTTAGSFVIEADAVETRPLSPGGSTTATGPAVFEVTVDDGEVLEFGAQPDSVESFVESIQVVDADGAVIHESYADDPAEGVTAIIIGATTVIVQGSGDYTASLALAVVQELAPGDPAAASGTAVFEFTVADGDAFTFSVSPESEDGYILGVVVVDPNGAVVGEAEQFEELGVSVEITDANTGPHRVIVYGYGDYTAILN
jgi:hypothetical protein